MKKVIIIFILLFILSNSMANASEYSNNLKIGIIDTKTFKVKKIISIMMEDYVAGVISREIPDNWPCELKKAMAVLIRSWAYSNKGRHKKEGFDFCNLTHCQAWQDYNLSPSKEKLKSIVGSTEYMFLQYRGEVISGFYHSTCGGLSTLAQDVFMEESVPYLSIVEDGSSQNRNCKNSPHFKYKSFINSKDMNKILSKILKEKIEFMSIKVEKRDDKKKRAKILRIETKNGYKLIKAYDFWMAAGQILGWNVIKSTYFDILRKNDGYVFTGYGNGHGLGLCQWGAKKIAEDGYSYEKILKFYYPKCMIGKIKL